MSEAINIWRIGPLNVLKTYMAFFIISFLFSLILYLFNVFTLEQLLFIYANIFFMVILFTFIIYFRFKEDYPIYYESIMQYNYYYYMGIVLIVISSIILLIVLLNHPELFYLNVLYILLGTLLVSFIDKILSKKEDEKKIFEKSKRIILASMNDIELNKNIVQVNLANLKEKHLMELEMKLLDKNFWDLINSNIADMEIENKLFQNFSLIRKDVDNINENILKRKSIIEKKSLLEQSKRITYNEKNMYIAQIVSISTHLEKLMEEFIKNSKSLEENIDYYLIRK